jgi:hypothetical protein
MIQIPISRADGRDPIRRLVVGFKDSHFTVPFALRSPFQKLPTKSPPFPLPLFFFQQNLRHFLFHFFRGRTRERERERLPQTLNPRLHLQPVGGVRVEFASPKPFNLLEYR